LTEISFKRAKLRSFSTTFLATPPLRFGGNVTRWSSRWLAAESSTSCV
jgi:hypothetical protein